ncbi:hypothetical protein KKE99_00595 [Patescibacteria group bacterium]|nr:hypothetical protein [Patescibacteria group bacterium]
MNKPFIRIIKLLFWIIGGITVVPMSLYILFGSVSAEGVMISPIIIHTVAIVWFLSIAWHFFSGIKNAKRDLQEFKEKQSIKQKKQEEYLMSQKLLSKLTRAIAIFSLIAVGIYISYVLSGTENLSTRMKIFGWLALFGLVIFFVQLLRTHESEKETFWKKFFHGTGFASDKERREANRNILILFILVVLGILAVFFF